MDNKEMATLTRAAELKLINALTDAFCLLKGSDLGKGIVGKAVVTKASDALQFFHSEKMRTENEKEWSDHSRNLAPHPYLKEKEIRDLDRECSSLSNPSDFEY